MKRDIFYIRPRNCRIRFQELNKTTREDRGTTLQSETCRFCLAAREVIGDPLTRTDGRSVIDSVSLSRSYPVSATRQLIFHSWRGLRQFFISSHGHPASDIALFEIRASVTDKVWKFITGSDSVAQSFNRSEEELSSRVDGRLYVL